MKMGVVILMQWQLHTNLLITNHLIWIRKKNLWRHYLTSPALNHHAKISGHLFFNYSIHPKRCVLPICNTLFLSLRISLATVHWTTQCGAQMQWEYSKNRLRQYTTTWHFNWLALCKCSSLGCVDPDIRNCNSVWCGRSVVCAHNCFPKPARWISKPARWISKPARWISKPARWIS